MKYFSLLLTVIFCANFVYAQKHSTAPPTVFERVEIEASYPGGDEAWRYYLMRSSILGETVMRATEKKIKPGTYAVTVRFVVNEKGKLSDAKATTNFGYGLEEGAIKAIKASGRWLPGEQGGVKVKSYRTQAITFVIN